MVRYIIKVERLKFEMEKMVNRLRMKLVFYLLENDYIGILQL